MIFPPKVVRTLHCASLDPTALLLAIHVAAFFLVGTHDYFLFGETWVHRLEERVRSGPNRIREGNPVRAWVGESRGCFFVANRAVSARFRRTGTRAFVGTQGVGEEGCCAGSRRNRFEQVAHGLLGSSGIVSAKLRSREPEGSSRSALRDARWRWRGWPGRRGCAAGDRCVRGNGPRHRRRRARDGDDWIMLHTAPPRHLG